MSTDTSDFFDDGPRLTMGLGGRRPGAGAKKGNQNARGRANRDDNLGFFEPDGGVEESAYSKYEKARAEKELHAARNEKVKADLAEGAVVDVQAVADAAAKAFAQCSQSLDAIGDMLEREGIAIEVCERVMEIVNAAKQQLAEDLERTHVYGL